MKMLILTVILVSCIPYFGLALRCYSCNQGYHTSTFCSNILPGGTFETCEGSNPECIQAVEWFQNGALQMVRRACWPRSSNGTGFCQNYPKKGVLKSCQSCTTDLCNNKIIYEPIAKCGVVTQYYG